MAECALGTAVRTLGHPAIGSSIGNDLDSPYSGRRFGECSEPDNPPRWGPGSGSAGCRPLTRVVPSRRARHQPYCCELPVADRLRSTALYVLENARIGHVPGTGNDFWLCANHRCQSTLRRESNSHGAFSQSVSHMLKQFYCILRLRSISVGRYNSVDLTLNRRYRSATMCKGWR